MLGAFGAVSNEDGDGPPGRCDEDLECDTQQGRTLSQRDSGLFSSSSLSPVDRDF